MITEVEEKRKDIQDLCERYGVIRLAIFGSAARGEFDPATSDLDFLVLFDGGISPTTSNAISYRGFAWKRCSSERLIS